MCEGKEVHNEWPVSEMVELSEMDCSERGGECHRVMASAPIDANHPENVNMALLITSIYAVIYMCVLWSVCCSRLRRRMHEPPLSCHPM